MSAPTEKRPIRVSFLGPEATFTHQAALRQFGEEAVYLPAPTIASVFDEMESGRADRGVVPVENALEGTVNITLDRLIDSPLHIVGEVSLPIDIHLLTKAASLEKIQRVMSHPHAVAQCQCWLRENLPGVKVEEVASTALAAKEAAADETCAALGSRMAAEKFGLQVLVEKLDTESINVTRFFVLGKEPAAPSDAARTSILFVLRNEPGTLYDALGAIARHGLNMTKIESRPSRRRAWDYIFFMDVDGHADGPELSGALAELREKTEFFRLLGSYPVSR